MHAYCMGEGAWFVRSDPASLSGRKRPRRGHSMMYAPRRRAVMRPLKKTDLPPDTYTFLTAAAKVKAFLDKIPGIKKLTAN